MAETYIVGETKVRPGAYFNIQKTGNNAAASIISRRYSGNLQV